jgi:hypothetical protein
MRTFRRLSVLVFIALLATFLLHLIWPGAVKWAFPLASWGGILFLMVKATRRRGALADLNVEVAGETLLTFGTVSIVLTIIHAFVAALHGFSAGGITGVERCVADIAAPFGEGLISSAIGTFGANYLRQLDATLSHDPLHASGSGASAGPGGAGSFSIDPTLQVEIDRLRDNVEGLNRVMGSLNTELEQGARGAADFNRMLQQVGSLLQNLNRFFAARAAPSPAAGGAKRRAAP